MPVLLIDRSLKVATPPAAGCISVPLRVPPPGLVPMASVTFEVSPVTRLPNLSSTSTVTAGLMVIPATVFVGCARRPVGPARAGVMLKLFEVAPPRLPSAAVQRVAGADLVDGQVAEGGDAAGRRHGQRAAQACRRPGWCRWPPSRSSVGRHHVAELVQHLTVTAGLIATPAIALVGCTPKTRWSAARRRDVELLEVAPPRLPSVAAQRVACRPCRWQVAEGGDAADGRHVVSCR